MLCFIYCRKSVYSEKGESVENQFEICRQYIFSKFPSVSEEDMRVYEDEGFSAKNTDRPQFKQMMCDIRTQRPDVLVCYRLDRISRSVSDFSSLIEELFSLGTSFVCVSEEFDTSKPMGKAMMYVASVFAQLERETTAERVRDNMLMLSRSGRWLGGTTPIGYYSEKQSFMSPDGRIRTFFSLFPDEYELKTVDVIFEKYLETRSLSAVSRHLDRCGAATRAGTRFSLPGIKDILQNPVYCTADRTAFDYFTACGSDVCFSPSECSDTLGLIAYNRRSASAPGMPRRSQDMWVVAIGRHEGRISGQKWCQVQRIIRENIPTGKAPSKTHNCYALLSGLIYCTQCGARMFAKSAGKRPGSFYYICASKLRRGTSACSCRNLMGRETDDAVFSLAVPYLQHFRIPRAALNDLERDLRKRSSSSVHKSPETKVESLQCEIERLLDILSFQNHSDVFIRSIEKRITELHSKISALGQISESPKKGGLSDAAVKAIAEKLISPASLDMYARRSILRTVIRRIDFDGETLHVYIPEPFPHKHPFSG